MINLLAMLDLFLPIKAVMTALQSYAVPPSKSAKFIPALINHLNEMSFSLHRKTPFFSQHINEVTNFSFKGKYSISCCNFMFGCLGKFNCQICN